MAKTTSNLGLIKPERSDNYSVDVMGENMDVIDARVGALEKTIPEEGVVNGVLYGRLYVNAEIATSGEVLYATCKTQSSSNSQSSSNAGSSTRTGTFNCFTVTGYVNESLSYPYKVSPGIYIYSPEYISGSYPTITIKLSVQELGGYSINVTGQLKVNGVTVKSASAKNRQTSTVETTVKVGDVITVSYSQPSGAGGVALTVSVPEQKCYLQTI